MISDDRSAAPDPAGIDLRLGYSIDVTALVVKKLVEVRSDERNGIAPLKERHQRNL